MSGLPPIEKGVPIPPPSTGGRKRKYPFDEMEVGDSFTLPLSGEIGPGGSDRVVCLLSCAGNRRRKTHGQAFRVRTEREQGVARCWRVK
jgi:hypothetical protein